MKRSVITIMKPDVQASGFNHFMNTSRIRVMLILSMFGILGIRLRHLMPQI